MSTHDEQVAGLRQLADLLEQHPEVASGAIEVSFHRLGTPAAIAAFVTDETHIETYPNFATARRAVGGITVTAFAALPLLSTASSTPEVRPLTLDEIRERVAQ